MTLKAKLYLLCVLLHTLLFTAAWQFTLEPGWGFMAVEGFLLLSMMMFIVMIRKALEPIAQIELFKDIINEQDFTARFPESNNRELSDLVVLFNQMLKLLYEERLKLGDRKGMLQQLMDALPTAIIVFDFEGKASQVNPPAQKMLGVSEQQGLGKSFEQFDHPIMNKIADLPNAQSTLLSTHSGKRYRVERNTFRDRGFDRTFVIVEEVTRELQSSEKKTYEKLIRLMSHEVNNTMAATSSLLKSCLHYADQIQAQERDDYQDAMNLVIQRIDHLSAFMQDFANMVRLPPPSVEICNLYHMLMATKRLYEVKLKELHITFAMADFPAEQALINVDCNQIEQVLINVVKNAIEAITDNGFITVDIGCEKNRLVLKIHDSGHGLSKASEQDLFTPFYTTKAQGQGLGLMLVREILDAHQIPFALYNRPQGGACFEISFEQIQTQ